MSTPPRSPEREEERPIDPEALGHPRGTLVIVLLFGLLFGLGWVAMYVYGFLARGAPHP